MRKVYGKQNGYVVLNSFQAWDPHYYSWDCNRG